MGFESSGADYLRRLKHDQEQVQTFPQSGDIPPDSPASSGSAERRGNPRYKCEGSATFRVQGSDVRSWSTFTDLSVSGCYVELKATFPVGSVIDLELDLNGMRAHVSGEVRVSYPFLGMGVVFRGLSPESRRQLGEMIDSLRPSIQKVQMAQSEQTSPLRSLPIILNPGVALQVLADFFETHTLLTKEEFIRLLRKSQGLQ